MKKSLVYLVQVAFFLGIVGLCACSSNKNNGNSAANDGTQPIVSAGMSQGGETLVSSGGAPPGQRLHLGKNNKLTGGVKYIELSHKLFGNTLLVSYLSDDNVNPDPSIGDILHKATGASVEKVKYGYVARITNNTIEQLVIPVELKAEIIVFYGDGSSSRFSENGTDYGPVEEEWERKYYFDNTILAYARPQ
ncbi:MAG: hypothetical protein WCL23_00850 [Candidatus Moraniibacteriota bacterium]